MKMTKKWGYVAGVCLTGILLTTTLAGCQSSESSKTSAVDSQKARNMKEADKAATEYMKAYIDMDQKKLNELHINKSKALEDKVTDPGSSDKLKGRYELFRYDLEEGSNEYYYKARFYHPATGGQSSVSMRMMKDKEDGKWKNHSWSWEDLHNLERIVGGTKPVQVHKWEGERE